MCFHVVLQLLFRSGVAKAFQIGVAKMFQSEVANVFECGVCKGISDWYLQRCSYFEKHLKLKSEVSETQI